MGGVGRLRCAWVTSVSTDEDHVSQVHQVHQEHQVGYSSRCPAQNSLTLPSLRQVPHLSDPGRKGQAPHIQQLREGGGGGTHVGQLRGGRGR